MSKKQNKKASNNPYALTEPEKKALDTLDKQALISIIGVYNKRSQFLNTEVFKLQHSLTSNENNNLQGTKKMEDDTVVQEDEVVIIQKQILDQQNYYQNQIIQFEYNKEKEYKQLMIDKARQISELNKNIENYTQEKYFLYAFPQRETHHVEQIRLLEQNQIEAKKQHADELQKYENNFIKQKKKIDEDQKEAIQKIKSNALEQANKKIRDAEQTAKENLKLTQDLELHKSELKELEIEKTQINNQNSQYKRSLQLNQEGIQEYQSVNHKQATKIKKLKEKIEYLQDFLKKEKQKHDNEVEQLQKTHQNVVSEMEYELKCLSENLRKKNKEAKDIKGVCQMILDQRTDIEQFFLESVDQVKEEYFCKINTENQNKNENNELKNGISGLKNKQYQESNTKTKFSITKLNEFEKEKILRLLFQKMNSQQISKPWRQIFDYNNLYTQRDQTIQEYQNDHIQENANN